MTEQKRKFSKLCLTGFILTMMPLVTMVLVFLCENAPRQLRIFITEKLLPFSLVLFPLAGFIVSIAGLVTARKKGKSGRGFGVAGAALPGIAAVIAGIIVGGVLINSAGTASKQRNNDMYGMGSVVSRGYWNTEYDVTQLRLPQGYDLKNITVSEAELKSYAKSHLQEITDESGRRVKGTYQNYTFLIIRSDEIDAWLGSNRPDGFSYGQGYASIVYEQTWEVGATKPSPLDVYKDPSDKFIVITNCGDYKVVSEFFGIDG